jgi:hypothetical protein
MTKSQLPTAASNDKSRKKEMRNRTSDGRGDELWRAETLFYRGIAVLLALCVAASSVVCVYQGIRGFGLMRILTFFPVCLLYCLLYSVPVFFILFIIVAFVIPPRKQKK